MNAGERLKKLRKANKMNLKELGTILNLSDTSISSMERGASAITTETAVKISKLFNVSLDYLILGIETEQTISESEQEILEVLRKDEVMTNVVMEIAKLKKKAINYARNYRLPPPTGTDTARI